MTATDVQWGQIRRGKRLSWHICDPTARSVGIEIALCNRRLDVGTLRDTRPGDERTCELCLRQVAE